MATEGTDGATEEIPVGRSLSHAAEAVELPADKATCQKVLRRFGYKGYKIDAIELPRETETGASARVYVLTQLQLQTDGEMRRLAKTLVFHFTDEDVRSEERDGWDVRD